MSEEDEIELKTLREEVKRYRVESRVYKEQCVKVSEAANEYVRASISFLRGRPGRNHPTMVAMRKLDRAIEAAEHLHVFVSSVVKHCK